MTEPLDYAWTVRSGKDDDDGKFTHHLLIDGASRIFARIYEPQKDWYSFFVSFEFAVEELNAPRDGVYFLELDQAKRFAEGIVAERDRRIEKAKQGAANPEVQTQAHGKTSSPAL